jgi:hypothetical protein
MVVETSAEWLSSHEMRSEGRTMTDRQWLAAALFFVAAMIYKSVLHFYALSEHRRVERPYQPDAESYSVRR